MKIKKITIENYRAFLLTGDHEQGRYSIDLNEGENLLLYGENGSGKSSLYRALKDFFTSSARPDLVFEKNLFYQEDQNVQQPYISVILSDDSEHFFSAERARTNTHLTAVITGANLTPGFISYRDLLKVHFRHNDSPPDLFSFFLGSQGLFSAMEIPTPIYPANRMSYASLWEKVKQTLDADALEDYNTNVAAQFISLGDTASTLLNFFHNKFSVQITYKDAVITGATVSPPEIGLKVTLFDKEIDQHDEVLNEARLTALAISIFFAFLLNLPPSDLQVLFLDDIFMGLDMSNRVPMMRILTAPDLGGGRSFTDFQIFLSTYDREWFNTAKSYVPQGWKKMEFFVDDHSHAADRPLIKKSGTFREMAEFHLIQGDYPASANYLRKAIEQVLRNILPENRLYPGFNSTSGENSVAVISKKNFQVSENEQAWFFRLSAQEEESIESFRFVGLQGLLTQFESLINSTGLPFTELGELVSIKNRLLNPMSHDDLRSAVFKSDLVTGIAIYDKLLKVKSQLLLSIEGESAYQLYCKVADADGTLYFYRFELLENLRYLNYERKSVFLPAFCRSIYRQTPYGQMQSSEHQYNSLNRIIKSIYHASRLPAFEDADEFRFISQEMHLLDGTPIFDLID